LEDLDVPPTNLKRRDIEKLAIMDAKKVGFTFKNKKPICPDCRKKN
jgi:hypothetical protein